MGRTCEDIIKIFKYLLLKSYFKLSDRGLVERTKTDLLFKYFLGYDPEETKLINPSLLTVFRRERLKDDEKNLMDKLINKTVEIALEKGLIEVKTQIIVDSTHTNAMFHHISPIIASTSIPLSVLFSIKLLSCFVHILKKKI